MSKYSLFLTLNSLTARLSDLELIEDEDDEEEEDDEGDSSSINDAPRRPLPKVEKISHSTVNTSKRRKKSVALDI